jgi:Ca2+-transporting ATPase
MTSYHSLSCNDALAALTSRREGLSSDEATQRQGEHGPNELSHQGPPSLWRLFFSQFVNPLIIILLVASTIKFTVASPIDGSVILATIAIMVLLSFFQEAKAEKAMEALRAMSAPQCRVRRGGKERELATRELTVGDIVLLEAGDTVPADCRLLDVVALTVNEAPLTGESAPVMKQCDPLPEETSLPDRKTMVYSGTHVAAGRATALVCAIGMGTEVGKIATVLQEAPRTTTPLQQSINRLSNTMLVIIALLVAGITAIGWKLGMPWLDLFLLAVAIAVAAIPEGLPAVVTVVLASGVRLMAKQRAIIRKLVAVETLGSTGIICSDKTGTLTQNEMHLAEVEALGDEKALIETALLCTNVRPDSEGGDPTEWAIVHKGKEIGIDIAALDGSRPRLDEHPFSSEAQYMATLHKGESHNIIAVKGSPERLLDMAELSDDERKAIGERAEAMAGRGLRLLAVASAETDRDRLDQEAPPASLKLLGLLGMIDPPRTEVSDAIASCHKAGIRVVMVTGDNPKTAQAIASQIGIGDGAVVSGKEVEGADEAQLDSLLKEATICARIQPVHKLAIVQAYQRLGHIVAMTGDGVNDAPALDAADIGVAMGIQGTDVAKGAADMVLSDDNFATIVSAVEEGRSIFERLRSTATFLLTTCFGEVGTILLAFLLLSTSPLEPLQILWINLITGSLLAIPIGMEPKSGDELAAPPRSKGVGLLFPGMLFRIALLSTALSGGAYALFAYAYATRPLVEAQTMTFCTIVLFEWLIAFQMRSDEKQVWHLGLFKNRMLLLASFISLLLFTSLLYVPILQRGFHTTALTLIDWGLCLIPGVAIFILETVRKALFPRLFSKGKWRKN